MLALDGVWQADLGSLYNPLLEKALSSRAWSRFVEVALWTRSLQQKRVILLAFKEGCQWNNFTDDWKAQIVSNAATKYRKHIPKWKIKCLFKALSLTIILKIQYHLLVYNLLVWLSLMALCFENLLSNGKAALVQLLRKMQRRGKRPRESTYHSYGHVQLIQKKR